MSSNGATGRVPKASGARADREPLGWISDEHGLPCVPGRRISNAGAYLTQRLLAGSVGAAAHAVSRAQTETTTQSSTGIERTRVVGDAARYALGQAASGAGAEMAAWLQARQAQSFDAIFVRPGIRVAIHLDREIPIDYDPERRRLAHTVTASQPIAAGLD